METTQHSQQVSTAAEETARCQRDCETADGGRNCGAGSDHTPENPQIAQAAGPGSIPAAVEFETSPEMRAAVAAVHRPSPQVLPGGVVCEVAPQGVLPVSHDTPAAAGNCGPMPQRGGVSPSPSADFLFDVDIAEDRVLVADIPDHHADVMSKLWETARNWVSGVTISGPENLLMQAVKELCVEVKTTRGNPSACVLTCGDCVMLAAHGPEAAWLWNIVRAIRAAQGEGETTNKNTSDEAAGDPPARSAIADGGPTERGRPL